MNEIKIPKVEGAFVNMSFSCKKVEYLYHCKARIPT